MSEKQPARPNRRDGSSGPPAGAPAPIVVTGGLTYPDLRRAVFLTFGLILVYHMAAPLTTLLLFFLLVFILAAVLNPVVVRLEKRGIPRIASAVGIAVLFMGVLALLGWLALPPLLDEAAVFVKNAPDKQARLTELYNGLLRQYPDLQGQLPPPAELLKQVGPDMGKLLGTVGRYTINLAVGVVSLLLLLVLVIYTVAHPTPLIAGLLAATPERYRDRTERALRRIMEQLKNWAFGSLILGLIIGIVCGIGLKVLGVPYALLFGVIAGVGELIPNIGPIISAIPPVLVALSDDPVKALWVILLFAVVQQLENNLIVPMVMGQSLNLHPVSLTFTVLVMGVLFGVLGAVLAVPVCAIIKVCWEEFYLAPQGTQVDELEDTAQSIVVGDSPDPDDEPPIEHALEQVMGDQDPEKQPASP